MAKKRPRAFRAESTLRRQDPRTKLEAAYWRRRLFRNTFTYRGAQREVAHWSVKIQHAGTRKTLSLRAQSRDEASAEACNIYKSILSRGWKSVAGSEPKLLEHRLRGSLARVRERSGLKPAYWLERLVERKYTEAFRNNGGELSARIEHDGASFYFPLRTMNRRMAAARAAEIYQKITSEGWGKANEQFSRELSVAFRWADDPVAWTYTTIQTRVGRDATLGTAASPKAESRLQVAIAEPDASVRGAICWCINQQPNCLCTSAFASAAEALREVPRRAVHLLLFSAGLDEEPRRRFSEQLMKVAPRVATLPYSIYEDSEQLFKSAPGGARGYLFRRLAAPRFLDPLPTTETGPITREKIAANVRRFFEQAAIGLPFGQPSHEHSILTPREHEIMGLLGKGHPDKEIADLLGISTWTVHGHLKKIFDKLGAHNRTDAVVKYLHK